MESSDADFSVTADLKLKVESSSLSAAVAPAPELGPQPCQAQVSLVSVRLAPMGPASVAGPVRR